MSRETRPGKPRTFIVEVGPLTYYDFSDAQIAAAERRFQRDLDRMARALVRVGPRSKVVRSRMEDAA